MKERFLYTISLVILLTSCEEYYKPDLDEASGLMVVESHITNDLKQNYIKLTRASSLYDTDTDEKITGAEVFLIEVGNLVITGIESSAGYYTFTKAPVPGKKYILRIKTNTEEFESDPVVMPSLPSIDSLYTRHEVKKTYKTNLDGRLVQRETLGRNICIDAPITPALGYYRFSWRAIIQWKWSDPNPGAPPHSPLPSLYGWISFYDKENFNFAGPKPFSVSDKIQNHPVLFLQYDTKIYLDSIPQYPQGWIVFIEQYGITKESYDFHQKLKEQFTAEGSLFDPVITQVYGNIHCKSDNKKLVFGFFDLSSYQHYRYAIKLGHQESDHVFERQIDRYPEILDRGHTIDVPPDFWESWEINNY